MPAVSVLIRSMDRSTLDRALASVAAQDDVDAEVVVVAACGPGHRTLPARCGPHPLRMVVPEQRLNRPAAANTAIAAAQGAWLNFLDDDDEFLPGHLQTLLAAARRQPECRLVHAQAQVVDAQGRPLYVLGAAVKPWLQLECGFIQFGCALFARSLWHDGARLDESLEILEDMDFFVQCGRLTCFAFVPQATSRYHVEEGDSGAGTGRNRDEQRIARTLAQIRAKWADLARQLETMPQARLARAGELLRWAKDAEAHELLATLVAEHPRDVNALNLCGVALLRLGQPREAQALFERALAEAPGNAQLVANLTLARSKAAANAAAP